MAWSRGGTVGKWTPWSGLLLLLVTFFALCRHANGSNVTYVEVTTADQQTIYLPDNRKPALYTGDFGDCSGGSLINVTRFDAAYYKDNMTVLFHLQGNTGVKNESLMSRQQSARGRPRFLALTLFSAHRRLRIRRESVRSDLQSLQRKHSEVQDFRSVSYAAIVLICVVCAL